MVIKTTVDFKMKDICLPSEVISLYPNHKKWFEKCIKENRIMFLLLINNEKTGCAIIKESHKYHKKIKLCYLYIIPRFRGKGYGSELVSAVKEYSKDQMMKGVYATTNPNAANMELCLLSNSFSLIGKTQSGDLVFEHLF